MGKRGSECQWIGDILNGRSISFTDSKTEWELEYKISEKTYQIRYPLPFEPVAVFIYKQTLSDDIGKKPFYLSD